MSVYSETKQDESKQRVDKTKCLLSNYDSTTPKLKQGLKTISYVFEEAGHSKLKDYGDDRYTVVYVSTLRIGNMGKE